MPFRDYNEYMEYMFSCVNDCLDNYLTQMKVVFASEQGGYKNVLYPDLEVAHDACRERVARFYNEEINKKQEEKTDEENSEEDKELGELYALLGSFSGEEEAEQQSSKERFLVPPESV